MVKKSLHVKKGVSGMMKHVDETEMWNFVAGAENFVDVQERPRSVDINKDDKDEVIEALFRTGKRKKRDKNSAAEIALFVENVMAELEVTAEEDAELNRQNKPAINKLMKLPLLTDTLMKKGLQQAFLDHGVLTILKDWLEPLPDGSMPSINVREAVLMILTDFHIDLGNEFRREQLKKSGLGKVIMFLSKYNEETVSNRKLAKDLVDMWSRPIFNNSIRFDQAIRNVEELERAPSRHKPAKKSTNKPRGLLESAMDDDFDIPKHAHGNKPEDVSLSTTLYTIRPEAMSLDFKVLPRSKIDAEAVRERGKQKQQDARRMMITKKLKQMKASTRKNLQAMKISVEGRGMVKYI